MENAPILPESNLETSAEKKKKKRGERIIKVADKAIEREAERPKSIYYGLEDDKKKQPESIFSFGDKDEEKPPIPEHEMLKSLKKETEEDDDEEEPVSEAE